MTQSVARTRAVLTDRHTMLSALELTTQLMPPILNYDCVVNFDVPAKWLMEDKEVPTVNPVEMAVDVGPGNV